MDFKNCIFYSILQKCNQIIQKKINENFTKLSVERNRTKAQLLEQVTITIEGVTNQIELGAKTTNKTTTNKKLIDKKSDKVFETIKLYDQKNFLYRFFKWLFIQIDQLSFSN